jgi:hypothetical protein
MARAIRWQEHLVAAFSIREMVGWLASSGSLSGKEPQSALSKGSSHKVHESFWSSYPQATWKILCRTSEAREWRPRRFRHSGTHSETASQRPSSSSILANHRSPPSEVMRPVEGGFEGDSGVETHPVCGTICHEGASFC